MSRNTNLCVLKIVLKKLSTVRNKCKKNPKKIITRIYKKYPQLKKILLTNKIILHKIYKLSTIL